jgi:hypothetical protein
MSRLVREARTMVSLQLDLGNNVIPRFSFLFWQSQRNRFHFKSLFNDPLTTQFDRNQSLHSDSPLTFVRYIATVLSRFDTDEHILCAQTSLIEKNP